MLKIKDENFKMKKKELKQLAARIAKLESIVERNEDSEKVRKAQDEIMSLSNRIEDPEDLFLIDEIVQEILEKENS